MRSATITDDLAAKLERAMGKPDGWMDDLTRSPRRTRPYTTSNLARQLWSLRLLISWVQAGEWTEIAGNFELGEADV